MKKKINLDDQSLWQDIDWDEAEVPEALKKTDAQVNIARANRLKANNPEFKEKISQSRIGKKLTSETIEKLTIKATGKEHTEQTKQKISKKLMGENNPMYGKQFSDEHLKKMSDGHKNRIVSDETRLKVSIAKLGKKRPDNKQKMLNLPKVSCPHCGKIGQEKVMKRWHFDNCKHK